MKHITFSGISRRCSLVKALLLLVAASCQKAELPLNPTLVPPISGLIITVTGIDYTAIPKLTSNSKFNDTLFISVKIPDKYGVAKQISLSGSDAVASVKEGDKIEFKDYVAPIVLNTSGVPHTYFVKMQFTPPPILYFIKTSDKDANGVKYYLNKSAAQKIASGTYDNNYEGYIDLTDTNWDNIGLIASDLSAYFDFNGGWYPEKSSGTFTLKKNDNPGTGFYPSAGPWANWKWTGSNSAIVSPGVWKLNYNSKSGNLDMVETQWSIIGTAVGEAKPLTYSHDTKTWSITTSLSTGKFKFTTIPVSTNDPKVTYGDYSASTVTGLLSNEGNDIVVKESGSYAISMDLSNAPYYRYSVTKN